ncbi:hypothetical protein AB0F46_16265 [Streptomyces sp. NPDC026665]|uniref:hypothetical protein n=1 Tax=Streptomyces sp. NPDC026665 TaxID=3154798 RepID=UPI003401C5F6
MKWFFRKRDRHARGILGDYVQPLPHPGEEGDIDDTPTLFVLNGRTYQIAEYARNDVVRLASGLVRAVLRASTNYNRNGLMAHMIHHDIIRFIPQSHSYDSVEMARSAFDAMAVCVADDLNAYETVDRMRSQIRDILDSFPPDRKRGSSKSAIGQWGQAVAGLRQQRLGPEDVEVAAPAAEEAIDHELARLFLRLGPPPEPTSHDYTSTGTDGGGAQQ